MNTLFTPKMVDFNSTVKVIVFQMWTDTKVYEGQNALLMFIIALNWLDYESLICKWSNKVEVLFFPWLFYFAPEIGGHVNRDMEVNLSFFSYQILGERDRFLSYGSYHKRPDSARFGSKLARLMKTCNYSMDIINFKIICQNWQHWTWRQNKNCNFFSFCQRYCF